MASVRIQDLDNTWIYPAFGLVFIHWTVPVLDSYHILYVKNCQKFRTVVEGTLEHLQRCSLCDLAKIFFTSKFSYLLFSTHKTETGIANRWGTSNRKPPGPIIMTGRLETLGSTQIVLLHSFLQVQSIGAPLTSHCALCNYAEPKLFSWSKPAYFDFCSSNFTVQGHILSTVGDALKHIRFNGTHQREITFCSEMFIHTNG
jgi:hypothetical protein